MIHFKKKKPDFFDTVIASQCILAIDEKTEGLSFLISFFNEIRPAPGRKKDTEKNLQHAILRLK